MSLLDHLLPHLSSAEGFARASRSLREGGDVALAAPGLIRPLVTAALFMESPRPTLVVLSGEEAAERYARHVASFLPRHDVIHFPTRADMPWDDKPADLAAVGRRARALHCISRGRPVVVVASARSLMRRVPPRDSQVFDPIVLAEGGTLELEAVTARLARMGYDRVERAEERGQYAVRGGTLDIFGSEALGPVRVELFGDEIESLARYVPSTQQAIGPSEPVEIYPCREVMLGTRAADHAERALGRRALEDTSLAHQLEMVVQGVYFNGVEQYLPVFYKQPGAATQYLPPSALVTVAEPRALVDDALRYMEEVDGKAIGASKKTEGLFLRPPELDLGGHQRLTLMSMQRAGTSADAELPARRPEVAGGEQRLVSGLRALLETDHRVVLTIPHRETRARVSDALVAAGLSVAELPAHVAGETITDGRLLEGPPAEGSGANVSLSEPRTPRPTAPLARGVVNIARADVPAGFVVPEARLALVGMTDIYPRGATRPGADPASLQFSFGPGDYVVHATHGIALFREIVRREVGDSQRDYLLLEYSRGDKLYVPVEHLDRVTKYVGPDGSAPTVTRLNTADWSRATGKARKAARKLAFDLVDLYARRAAVEGFAFSPDTPWQMEMEAAFPFEETPDQLAAIADTKADMESTTPMDRLVCGDVGYGKTEVAIRAAFKATQDGRQVMVLCPTTILAQQHFTTFSERFAPFPVKVEVLSRFRTKTQQAEALAGFASGEVGVLIGTHRLLSRDVTPRDLGLVIVDEEQRFGVEHKEHVKNLREQVDVLTLTATPIPRTLQMSLSGVRDMSIIDTPPPNRFPVHVHVGEYDPKVVSDAIRLELGRGGQVYYVSNRVRMIDEALKRVQEAVPEARVAVGHGQMSEHQLERVMESFSANQADVLVATTIIESGIDNPHSNTLIIEDSQRLGLAQLYQLKGRVGRSHVRAYAYFLFPPSASLTEQAYERLTAIQEHTELGSGLKVAMRDLEIRGAGSLLGAEQHGNMSAVGFDLYAQMLREAVVEARGEAVVAFPEVRVDLPVAAYLPAEYVESPDDRVAFYRRLAAARTPEAVARVSGDLMETYGPPPAAARDLLSIAKVKAQAAAAGAGTVSWVKKRLVVMPVDMDSEARGRVSRIGGMYLERERKVLFPPPPDTSPAEAAVLVLDAILADAPRT